MELGSNSLPLNHPPIVQNRGMDWENLKKKFNLAGREIEVSKLICAGFSNKAISEKLFVGEYTSRIT